MSGVSGYSFAWSNTIFGSARPLPFGNIGWPEIICLAFAYVKMFNFMTTSVMNPEVIDVQLAFI